ncbi:MAG: hypothetical protein ABIZ56_07100 [Chthoniobacteraceae bacterium]
MAERTKIFFAYCFPEKRWLDRVQSALEPFAAGDRCVVWDERKLKSGIAWKTELPEVLATTKVAMMIVSDLFLESDFITRAKLPALLEKERESGLKICWVLAGQCLFELAGLKESDAGNRVGSAFDGLGLAQRDAAVAEIAKKVANYLGVEAILPKSEPVTKKPLLPSAIPQVIEPQPVRKKKRNIGPKKPEEAETPLSPLLPTEPAAAAPIPAAAPMEKSSLVTTKEPESAPVTRIAEVPPAEPARVEIAPPAEPAPAEKIAPVSTREHLLETMIQLRQASVVKLSRLGSWMIVFAIAFAFGALVVLFLESIEHFLFVIGFAIFVAGLGMWLNARARFLGQELVGMRYTSSGLADEFLPTRQRETLMRKADEYLSQN